MKKTLFAVLVAAIASLLASSCGEKENTTPLFVGTYDITVVTDSVGVDDQLYSAEFYTQITGKTEPVRYGTLSIASADEQRFTVALQYAAEGSTVVYAYSTTATLDELQRLVMDDCQTQSGSSTLHFSARPFAYAEPLRLHTEMSTLWAGMNCRYLMSITAQKQI